MPSGPSLNITTSTTAAQLRDFASQLEGGQKLKGKENKDGSYTVWASTSDTTAWAKLTGKAEMRSTAAKQAITSVIANNPHLTDTTKGDMYALLGTDASAKPSTTMLKSIANFTAAMESRGRQDARTDDQPMFKELPIDTRLTLRDSMGTLAGLMNTASMNKGAYDTEVSTMAQSLATALGTDPLASAFPGAALTDGKDLIEDMTELMLGRIDNPEVRNLAAETAKSLATQVFKEAADIYLGGSYDDETQSVTIGDTVYDRKEELGKGAFGTAFRYESTDGTESIAVKFQNNTDEGTKESFLQEIPAHKRAGSTGHDNVLEFKAAMTVGDGQLAIATELAPLGDAFKAMSRIQEAITDGNITPEAGRAVQLTLIQDMIAGVGDMHTASGMTHIDFKPPNVFIDGDGVAKVADFGTSTMTENPFLVTTGGVDNPTWKGATVLSTMGGSDMTTLKSDTGKAGVREFVEAFFPKGIVDGDVDRTALKDEYNLKTRKFVEKLGKDLGSAAEAEITTSTTFDGVGYDMFALGVSAVNVLTGDLTLSGTEYQFSTQQEEDIRDFVDRGVLAVGSHEGALRPSLGGPEVDDLVNALTHPDVNQRPHDFDAVLNMPVFDLPHVGSDEARLLLRGIMAGDGDLVSEANTAFD